MISLYKYDTNHCLLKKNTIFGGIILTYLLTNFFL